MQAYFIPEDSLFPQRISFLSRLMIQIHYPQLTQASTFLVRKTGLQNICLPTKIVLFSQKRQGKKFSEQSLSLRKMCPYSELFWSVFSQNARKNGPEQLTGQNIFDAVFIIMGQWKTEIANSQYKQNLEISLHCGLRLNQDSRLCTKLLAKHSFTIE